jgi:hypothetical protein
LNTEKNWGLGDWEIEELRNSEIQGLINKIDRIHSIPKFAIPESLNS